MSLSYALPAELQDIRTLVLVPSAALLRMLKDEINATFPSKFSLRSAPLLADCYIPYYLSSKTLLIGPFIGADGISYLARLLLSGKKNTQVYFLGFGGGIKKNIKSEVMISDITHFYIEDKKSVVHLGENDTSTDNTESKIISTKNPQNENLESVSNFHEKFGIGLLDMECSFLKEVCTELQAEFHPSIIVRDEWDLSTGTHTILSANTKKKQISPLLQKFLQTVPA